MADLWRKFWHHHRDLGAGAVAMRKVKAHSTKKMVEEGLVLPADKQGNDAADSAAKAALAKHNTPVRRCVRR